MPLGIGIGLSPLVRNGSVLNLDIHAKAYIDAEGITDLTAIRAINTLVKDLKAINSVQADFVNFDVPANSNRKAIYPFPGTFATSNKRNLIAPTDSDANYRLIFSSNPVISNLGVNFNSSKYANTKFAANLLDVNDCEFDIALTSSGSEATNQTEFGAYSGGGSVILQANNAGLQVGYIGTAEITSIPSITGFFEQVQSEGTAIGKRFVNKDNNKKFNTAVVSGTLPSSELWIGGLNSLGRYSNRTFGWCSFGKAINLEANSLYLSAIAKYSYAMNRLPLVNILFEGHSFFALNSIPSVISNNLNSSDYKTFGFKNLSVGGNKVSDMVARTSTTDTYKKAITGIPIKNIEIIWIGANDTQNEYSALANYLTTQSSKGWHFIVCTMTPITTSLLPAWRNDFNANIRNNTANIPNYHVFDTDLYPELCDPTNTTYFNADKLHLAAAGNTIAGNGIAEILKTL